MITETPTIQTSSAERSQLDRIDEAKRLWREGRSEDALILMDALKGEPMSDRVTAELYVNESVFYAETGDMERSWAMLWEEAGNKDKQGAAYLNVAECYLTLGDLEQAQSNLDRAFSLLTNSFYLPHAHETQAKIYLAQGMAARAAKSIATALSLPAPDNWRAGFLATQDQIESRLLEALQVNKFSDWDQVKLRMVRRALQRSKGNPAGAAGILGVTRFAIQSLINNYPNELEPYRMPKRVRHKSIIKKLEKF